MLYWTVLRYFDFTTFDSHVNRDKAALRFTNQLKQKIKDFSSTVKELQRFSRTNTHFVNQKIHCNNYSETRKTRQIHQYCNDRLMSSAYLDSRLKLSTHKISACRNSSSANMALTSTASHNSKTFQVLLKIYMLSSWIFNTKRKHFKGFLKRATNPAAL